ncbi:Putative vacuolar protein sorting-associated protein 13A [Durusdinium trenchii]|uniref:Vacuolar protein sorting-associated protein 13A n=1 Tax=Durusdinium trenchii TaxID=1381693 RepID=A0ABP0QQW8_9DINO
MLSYAWKGSVEGEDGKVVEVDVKERVTAFRERVEEKFECRLWQDVRDMGPGDIQDRMAEGVRAAQIFVPMITPEYVHKVDGGAFSEDHRTDSCQREFNLGMKVRGPARCIPVVLHHKMRAVERWGNRVLQNLGDSLYVDFTSDDKLEDAVDTFWKYAQDMLANRAPAIAQFNLLGRVEVDSSLLVLPERKAREFVKGMREWIFAKMNEDWLAKSTWTQVFVILGGAGLGKSVCLGHICDRGGLFAPEQVYGALLTKESLERRPSLRQRVSRRLSLASEKGEPVPWLVVAAHFFKHDDSRLQSAETCLISVAAQLCRTVPGFRNFVSQAQASIKLSKVTLTELFRRILAEPLHQIKRPNTPRVMVVLDALDECRSEDRKELLNILQRTWREEMPPWIGVVASSRPEDYIPPRLQRFAPTELKAESEANLDDMRVFLRHKLSNLMADPRELDEAIDIVLERSRGHFLYARFIESELAELDGRLSIEDVRSANLFPTSLDGYYEDYFSRFLHGALGGDMSKYRALLSAMCAARSPITIDVLQFALKIKKNADALDAARKVGQLLEIGADDTLRFVHKSMSDYLTDPERCVDPDLRIDADDGLEILTEFCDECATSTPFGAQHAIYYLCRAGRHERVASLLCDFPSLHAMLVEQAAKVDRFLEEAHEHLVVAQPDAAGDACIVVSVLQGGIDGLRFNARELAGKLRGSLLKREHPVLQSMPARLGYPWLRPVTNSLLGRDSSVFGLAANAQALAVGTGAREILLVDRASGSTLRTLRGHDSKVTAVAVRGDTLVSGGPDCTVRVWSVWDKRSGACLRSLGASWVFKVAADDQVVAAACYDSSVHVWSRESWKRLHRLRAGAPVETCVLRPDVVVAGTWKGEVLVWDKTSGDLRHRLKHGEHLVLRLVADAHSIFSSDISGSVRTWQLPSGTLQRSFEFGSSPNHTQAVVCGDETLRVWERDTGRCMMTLEGRADGVAIQGDEIVSWNGGKKQRWSRDTGKRLGQAQNFTKQGAASDIAGPWKVHGQWNVKGVHVEREGLEEVSFTVGNRFHWRCGDDETFCAFHSVLFAPMILMFEKAVEGLLRRYLRDYLRVDDVSLDKLVVSLWSGHLEIEMLELQGDALQQLFGLQLHTKSGKIGKLTVDVPWSALQSQPVVIRLAGVEIVGEVLHDQDVVAKSAAEERALENQGKRARLEQLEQLAGTDTANDEDSAAGGADSGAGDSFWEKLGTKILDNLQLELEDVHLEIQDPVEDWSGCVRIDELALLSCDENWRKAFVASASKMRKLGRIKHIRVHLDNRAGTDDLVNVENLVFHQGRVLTKLTMHKATVKGPTEQIQVSLQLDETECFLRPAQIAVVRGRQLAEQERLIPETPRVRWARIIDEVRGEIRADKRERKRVAWVMARRNLYVSLFKRRLDATRSWLESLSAAEQAQLTDLEESPNMLFSDIVQLRKVAYAEVRLAIGDPSVDVTKRRTQQTAQNQKSGAPASSGSWLMSWWNSGSSKPSAAPVVSKQVTEEDRQALFDTIGYDPTQDDVATIDIKTLRIDVSVVVSNSSLQIVDAKGIPAADLELGKVQADMGVQGYLRSLRFVADSCELHDVQAKQFPDIITIRPSAAQSDSKLLVVDISREAAKAALKVDVQLQQPLNLLYSTDFVSNMTAIADAAAVPSLQRSAAVATSSSPSAAQTYAAAYSETSVEQLLGDADSVPAVSLLFRAPTIIIPETNTSARIEIGLGTFEVGQTSSNVWKLKGTHVQASVVDRVGTVHPVLSEIKFDAQSTFCADTADLATPRALVAVFVPELAVRVPMEALVAAHDIFDTIFEEHEQMLAATSVSRRRLTAQQRTSSLAPMLTVSEQEINAEIANRTSLQLHVEVSRISFELKTEQNHVRTALKSLQLRSTHRTFDSHVTFSAHTIEAQDLQRGRSLLSQEQQQDDKDNLFKAQLHLRSPHSPLFQGLERIVEADFGHLECFVHQPFVLSWQADLQNFARRYSSTTTPVAAVQASGERPELQAQSGVGPLASHSFSSQTLRIQLSTEAEDDLVHFELGKTTFKATPESLHLDVAHVDFASADRRFLIVGSDDDDARHEFSVSWAPETGYFVEADAFRLLLDRRLIQGMSTFLEASNSSTSPLPSSPAATRQQQPMQEDEPAARLPNIELRLKNPDKPFVFEFESASGLRGQASVKGLKLHGGRFQVDAMEISMGSGHRIGAVRQLSMGRDRDVQIASAEVVVNPSSRALAIQAISWLGSKLSTDQPTSPAPAFTVDLDALSVTVRDVDDGLGVVLEGKALSLGTEQLVVGGLRFRDEDGKDPTQWLWWEQSASTDDPVITIDLGLPVLQVSMSETACFVLHPISQGAATALVRTVVSMANAFSTKQNDHLQEQVAQQQGNEESEKVRIHVASLQLLVDTFRPRLGNLALNAKAIEVVIDNQNRVTLEAKTAEFLGNKVELRVSVVPEEDKVMQVSVELSEDTSSFSLTPENLYMINSALKDNLLLAAAQRPEYEVAGEKGLVVLSLESKQIELGLLMEDEDAFLVAQLLDFDFLSDGRSGRVTLQCSKARLGAGDEQLGGLLEATNLESGIDHAAEGDVLVDTYSLSAETMWIEYNANLIQEIIDFGAAIVRVRLGNLLAHERDESAPSLLERKSTRQIVLKSVTVVVPAGGSAAEFGLVATGAITGFVDTLVESGKTTQVAQNILQDVQVAVCGLKDHAVTAKHPIVDRTNVNVKVTSDFLPNGLCTSSEVNISIEDIVVNVLMPLIPHIDRIVRDVLHNRPSQQVVRDAIVSESEEILANEPTFAAYAGMNLTLALLISRLEFNVLSKASPVLCLLIEDPSEVQGSGLISERSVSGERSFEGELSVRGLSVRCFNPNNVSWEPVLETCQLSCSLETLKYKVHRGVRLAFHSASPVRLNVHVHHIEAIRRAAEDAQAIVAALTNELTRAMRDESQRLENIGDGRECVVINSSEEILVVQGTPLGPGEEVSVLPTHKRVSVNASHASRKLPIVPGDTHVLTDPSLVSYVASAKRLVFASTFSVHNASDLPFQVCVMHKDDAAIQEGRDGVNTTTLDPDGLYFVPSFLVSADSGKNSVCFRFANNEPWSVLAGLEAPKRRPEAPVETLVHFMERTMTIRVRVDQASAFPLTRIEMHPVLDLVNSLPATIQVQVLRVAQGGELIGVEDSRALEPGSHWPLYLTRTQDVAVRFAFSNAPDVFGRPVLLQGDLGTRKYVLEDRKSARVQEIRFVRTHGTIELFSPFWIVNASNLALKFGLPDCRELLNEPKRDQVIRVVEECWENQRKFVVRGWIPELLPGERPSWSDKSGQVSRRKEQVGLPVNDSGWEWETPWKVDLRLADSGADGWQYCSAFMMDDWGPTESWNKMIRRRRWTRVRLKTLDETVIDHHQAADLDDKIAHASVRAFGRDACRVALEIDGRPGPWSDPIALSIGEGSSNVFPLRRSDDDNSFFDMVLSVKRHPMFPRTMLCTFSPRVVLVSEIGQVLRCIQAGTFQPPVRVDNAAPFHWFQPLNGKALLQIQVASSHWSKPFAIGTVDEFVMTLPECPFRVKVEMRRSEVAATLLIVFRQDEETQPLYKLQNVSLDTVICSQKGVELQDEDADDQVECRVGPYTSRGFGMVEPLKPHLVQLRFEGHPGHEVEIDMSKVGVEQRISLPPLERGAPSTDGTDKLLAMDTPLLFDVGSKGLRWIAQPPSFESRSVFDSAAASSRLRAAWVARLSATQATAVFLEPVTLVQEDQDDQEDQAALQEQQSLRSGASCRITCVSRDGRNRVLQWQFGAERTRDAKEWTVSWVVRDQAATSSVEPVDRDTSPVQQAGDVWTIRGEGAQPGDALSLDRPVSFSLSAGRSIERTLCMLPSKSSGWLVLASSEEVRQNTALESSFGAMRLDRLAGLPARFAFVTVDIDGSSRVIRVSEASLNDTSGGDMSASSSGQLAVAPASVEQKIRADVSFRLPDFGVSLITLATDGTPTELAYLSTDILFGMIDTNVETTFKVLVRNLRFDNQLDNPTFVNLGKRSYDKQASELPILDLEIVSKHTQLNVVYVQQVRMTWAPFDIHLDDQTVESLREFVEHIQAPVQTDDQRRANEEARFRGGVDFFSLCANGLDSVPMGSRMVYIRKVSIGEIRLRLSYFKNNFADIEGARISFDAARRTNIAARSQEILHEFKSFYMGQVRQNVFSIIGFALPLNPGEIFSSLGNDSSASGIFKGAVRGVAAIGTLGSTIAKVDKDYNKYRDSKPQNAKEGVTKGMDQISNAFRQGVDGFFSKPKKGAEKDGIAGALSGFGEGMFGLIAKPVSGGIAAETKTKAELEAERQRALRARPPRLFQGSRRTRMLEPFDARRTIIVQKMFDKLQPQLVKLFGDAQRTPVHVASFFFDPMPFCVIHGDGFLCFGSFQDASKNHRPPPPPPPALARSGGDEKTPAAGGDSGSGRNEATAYGSAEQRRTETLSNAISIQVFWFDGNSLDSTQEIEAAVQFWCDKLGLMSLNRCEQAVRDAWPKSSPVSGNLEIVERLNSGFKVSNPPRMIMELLRATVGAAQEMADSDAAVVLRVADIIAASTIWRELPLLILATTRAYTFVPKGGDSVQTFSALQRVERAIISIVQG